MAFLVEAADDICYTIMDIEDGVRLHILPFSTAQELLFPIIDKSCHAAVNQRLKNIQENTQKIGYLRAKVINELTAQCCNSFIQHLTEIENGTFCDSLLSDIPGNEYVNTLKNLAADNLYNYQPVAEIETAGFEIIHGLLEIILDLQTLPQTRRNRQRSLLFPKHVITPPDNFSLYEKLLTATDFISGLTDGTAINLFNKIRGVSFPRIY